MNENLLRRIKRQLDAKFYVMKDVWLKDCVEYLIRHKPRATDRQIFEFVESQILLNDLREISNECLPRNLVQQTSTILNGTYVLQVDKMYDIASSKYNQLCEIRKIGNDNLEVTEEEKPAELQPKGRRMMQLHLTDGVQDVIAIEYTPVKQITGTLFPGSKVMIIGPVVCRRGIILLEDSKYKEIGGEVDFLLKSNALENVLARALGEPENPDPYNDNEPHINQNTQNTASNLSNDDNLFDDDFEEAVDLEAVTALERRNQETEAVQGRFENILEETLQDIDFEPFENWPGDSPRPLRVLSSRVETKTINENDILIIGEASTSTHNFRSEPPLPTSPVQNQNFSEFPDDDFESNDFDVVIKTKDTQSQHNPLKNKNETCPSVSSTLKSMNRNVPMEIEKCTSMETTQNEKSMTNSLKSVQQMPKIKTSNFFKPPPAPKICDILSDVLREPITGTMYRTVRGQVENHSKLTKQDKCWSIKALITDHTSSVEVCFKSEVLEEFLGFTVQEFSRKKKLAKSDPQVKEELVLNLRKAQGEIQNLDALLKLELVQDQMPKVVGITQLTQQQKKDLTKRSM